MASNQTAQPLATTAPLEYDSGSMTYHTRYEPTVKSAASLAIVEAIAAIEACDPRDLPVALYDCIDPDALDALFRTRRDGTPRSGGRVEFTFDAYDVCVHADGRISIRSHQS